MTYVNHLKRSTKAHDKPKASRPVVKPRKTALKKGVKGVTQDDPFLFI